MKSELKKILTNSYKEGMIKFLNNHPESFDEALQLALIDDQPYSWRSAWLLWSCTVENDSRLIPFQKEIFKAIPNKKDGHQRELIKLLLLMDLEDDLEGLFFDTCVNLWQQIHKSPSVRFTAFRGMIKCLKKYPELKDEILFLTQNQYLESLSQGVKRSVKRYLKEAGVKSD